MVKSQVSLRIGQALLAALAVSWVAPTQAQNTTWIAEPVDTNFFNDANWSNTAPDTVNEYGLIDSTDVGHMAIIDAGTGMVDLDGVNLGEFSGGANVIQNGGTLVFDAFTESKFGGDGANPSTWVMNNDSMILYDSPFAGGGYGFDGVNSSDFDVGNGTSVATLELHDTAILRISDDMKISDNGTALGGHVLLDGNSQITAGSGTSMGSDGPASLTIADNALYVSGNSAGPGNSAQGSTNEGYLAINQGEVLVKDSGRFWIRTLQGRGGASNFTIQDNGRFDVFDVFFNAAPDLGNATVEGDAQENERTSFFSESVGSSATVTITGNGTMTVDSDVGNPNEPWNGLALSGGNNRGGNNGGGTTLIDVQEQGTFIVQQDLNMTMGFDVDAASTLKVTGPDATVNINGDLRMSIDPFDVENLGSSTLLAAITGSTHSTIAVGGEALIGFGSLAVELDGYSPIGGESYTLLTAGSVVGTAFRDTSLPELPGDGALTWDLNIIGGTSITLDILGMLLTVGDMNGDGAVNFGDLTPFTLGLTDIPAYDAAFPELAETRVARGDVDGDTFFNFGDLTPFVNLLTGGGAASGAAVPEPSALLLLMAGAGLVGFVRRK